MEEPEIVESQYNHNPQNTRISDDVLSYFAAFVYTHKHNNYGSTIVGTLVSEILRLRFKHEQFNIEELERAFKKFKGGS